MWFLSFDLYTIVLFSALAVWIGFWSGICFPHKIKLPVVIDPSQRFCRDCRHFLPARGVFGRRSDLGQARCMHVTAIRQPEDLLVRGYLHEDNMGYASIQRQHSFSVTLRLLIEQKGDQPMSACGPGGRYWEKKVLRRRR